MCGIAGVVKASGGVTQENVLAMAATLVHRGPNAGDAWVSPDGIAGLGHRRLSIIDLTTGDQPMCDAAGNWVAYNG